MAQALWVHKDKILNVWRERMRATTIAVFGLAVFMLGAIAFSPSVADAAQPKPGYCEPKDVSAALLKDCRHLLKLKDRLDNTGVLNWSLDVKIRDWTGVGVNQDRTAVVGLKLPVKGLVGEVPSRLGRLSGLERIDLSHNALTGPVPSTLGKLANLKELNLRGNRLSGKIPSALGDLESLRRLSLADNDLQGAIPTSLAGLSNLERLALDKNSLTGEIPAGLGELPDLRFVWLSNNRLTGTLPPSLGASDSLQYLRVKNNELTGQIPDTYGDRDWRCLLLAGNDLDDECLPSSLKGRVKTQDMKACPN